MRKLLAGVMLFHPFFSFATIRNAATCNVADIQTQITASANTGDQINVPGGSCAWGGTSLNVNKDVTIVGSGQGVTNITASNIAMDINVLSGGTVDISGMTITGGGNSNGFIQIDGPEFMVNAIRIHHMTISTTSGRMFAW